jgi:hypothetical protein
MLRADAIQRALSVTSFEAFFDSEDVSQANFAGNRHAIVAERLKHPQERPFSGAEERLSQIVKVRLYRSLLGNAFVLQGCEYDRGHGNDDDEDEQ